MESQQFYSRPLEQAPKVRRRKLIRPLSPRKDSIKNHAAGAKRIALVAENQMECEEPSPQIERSQIRPQGVEDEHDGNAPITDASDLTLPNLSGFQKSQTIEHQQASSIPNFTSETLDTGRSFSISAGSGTEELNDLELIDTRGLDTMISSACEIITSNVTKTLSTDKQDNCQRSASLLKAKGNKPSASCSKGTLPCQELQHRLSNSLPVGPCESCIFKDGQIFALVQILHKFHHGQKQTWGTGNTPQSRQTIRTVPNAKGAKGHQKNIRSHRVLSRDKETERSNSVTSTDHMRLQKARTLSLPECQPAI